MFSENENGYLDITPYRDAVAELGLCLTLNAIHGWALTLKRAREVLKDNGYTSEEVGYIIGFYRGTASTLDTMRYDVLNTISLALGGRELED